MSINIPPYDPDYLGGQIISPFNLCCDGQEPVFKSRIITDTLFFTIVQYTVKGDLNPPYIALNADGLVGSTPQSAISQVGSNALPLLPPLDNTVSTLVQSDKARDCCDPCNNSKFPKHICPIASRKNTPLYGSNIPLEEAETGGSKPITVSETELTNYFSDYVPIYIETPGALNSFTFFQNAGQSAIPYGTHSNDLVTFYPSFSKINTGQANKDPYNRLIIDSGNLIRGVTSSCSKLSYVVISRDSINDLLKYLNSLTLHGYIPNPFVQAALNPLNVDTQNLDLNGFWIRTCGCEYEFMTTDLTNHKLTSKKPISKSIIESIIKDNWKYESKSTYRKLYEVCTLRKIPLVDNIKTIVNQINQVSNTIPPFCIEWRFEKDYFLVPYVWVSRIEIGIQQPVLTNILNRSGWRQSASNQFRHLQYEVKCSILQHSQHSSFGGTIIEGTPRSIEYFYHKVVLPYRWRNTKTKTSEPLPTCLVIIPRISQPGFEIIGEPDTLKKYFPNNISIETNYSKVFVNETISAIKNGMSEANLPYSPSSVMDSVPYIFKNSPIFLCQDSTIWMDSEYIPHWEYEIAQAANWIWKVGDIELKDEIIKIIYDTDENMTIYGNKKSLDDIYQQYQDYFETPDSIRISHFRYKNPKDTDMVPILVDEWEKIDEDPKEFYCLWQHRSRPHQHMTSIFKNGHFRIEGEQKDVQKIDKSYRIDQDIQKLEEGVSRQEKKQILEKEMDNEVTVIPTGVNLTILPLCNFVFEDCPYTESFQVIGDATILKDICPEDTACCRRVFNEEYTSFTIATYYDDFQRALTENLPVNIPDTYPPGSVPQNIPYAYPNPNLKWFLDDCCESSFFCRPPNRYRLYNVSGESKIATPYFIELVNIIPSTQVVGSIRVLNELILPIILFYRWDYMKAGDEPRIDDQSDLMNTPASRDLATNQFVNPNQNNPSTASRSTVIIGKATGYTGMFERGTRPSLNQLSSLSGSGDADRQKVAIQTIFWNLNHDDDSYCDLLWAVDIPTARSNFNDPIPTACGPLGGETAYRMTNAGFYGNTSGPPSDYGGPINDNGGLPPIAPPQFTNGNVLIRSKGKVAGTITVKYVKISGYYNVIRFFDNVTTNLQTAIQANELMYRDWIRVVRQQKAENELIPLLVNLERQQRLINSRENQALNPDQVIIINMVIGKIDLLFSSDNTISDIPRLTHSLRKLLADSTESSISDVFVEYESKNTLQGRTNQNGQIQYYFDYHIIVQTNDIYNTEVQFERSREVQRQLEFLQDNFNKVKDHYPPLHLAETLLITAKPEAFILRDDNKATFPIRSPERVALDRQQEAQLVQYLIQAENNNRDPLRPRANQLDRSNAFFQIAGINSQNQQRWLEQQVNRLANMSERPIPIQVPTPETPYYRFRDGTPVSGFLQNAFTTGMTLPLNPPPPLVGPAINQNTPFVETNMNFLEPLNQ